MSADPLADTRTVCAVCGSSATLLLPAGWEEARAAIPIVGCGHPWHYDFPVVTLGPYSLRQLGEEARADIAAAVAAADVIDPRIITAIRVTAVDPDTGEEVRLPAACLTCGYAEVPGADFEAHDCDLWDRSSPDERSQNLIDHLDECRRLVRQGATR